jgi:hypothetical protein
LNWRAWSGPAMSFKTALEASRPPRWARRSDGVSGEKCDRGARPGRCRTRRAAPTPPTSLRSQWAEFRPLRLADGRGLPRGPDGGVLIHEPDGDREPMTGVKLKLEDRWKHRPTAPAPVASPLSRVDEARAWMDKTRIARWVAAQIVNYPLDRCLCSRRPIVFGSKCGSSWSTTMTGSHVDCVLVWRLDQEALARRAMSIAKGDKR